MNNSYTPSKPHPIIALLIDIYIFSPLFVVIISLLFRLFSNNSPQITIYQLIIYSVIILVCVIYHRNTNILNNFLSPGELITGKIIIDKQKYWTNPYKLNRFFIFLSILSTIIWFGGYVLIQFDPASQILQQGYVLIFIVLLVWFAIYIMSFIFIGKGKLLFILFPIITNILIVILSLINIIYYKFEYLLAIIILLITYIVTLFIYNSKLKINAAQFKDKFKDVCKTQKYSFVKLLVIAYLPLIIGILLYLMSIYLIK